MPTLTRQLYESTEQEFNLNPDRVFEIVSKLSLYAEDEKDYLRYVKRQCFPGLYGSLRTLRLTSSAVDENGVTVSSKTLAELVLSDDGKSLSFKIHPVKKLLSNPQDLESIGKEYKLSEPKKKEGN